MFTRDDGRETSLEMPRWFKSFRLDSADVVKMRRRPNWIEDVKK